jgi:thermitase
MRRLFGSILCLWLLATTLPATAAAAREHNTLKWRVSENKVEADLTVFPLEKVLTRIRMATGWKVMVEPNTGARISTKFKNVSGAEALRLLLGGLNYAVVPDADGERKLLVYRTSVQAATQSVSVPKDLIRNELVVTLDPNSKETIEALAEKLGAKILGRAEDQKSYRLGFEDAKATAKAVSELEKDPNIASAENNYTVHHPDVPPNVTGTEGGSYALTPVGDGKHTIVSLIDTPVQAVPADMAQFLLDPIHVAGAVDGGSKDLLHGTAMAETVLHGLTLSSEGGTSPVRILPIDVYGNNPSTTSFDVAAGIRAGLANGSQVMVMSLGGDGESDFLAQAVFEAEQRGAVIIAAAGNQPTGRPVFPAAFEGVVGVTAIDQNGTIAPYANTGSFVSAAGPGVSIVQYDGSRYMVTGTSSSTAFLGGAAAGFWSSSNSGTPKTPDQVRAYLKGAFPVPK